MPARVPINFFVMAGRRVREHFGTYRTEAYVDEAYFTALLTKRAGMAKLAVLAAAAPATQISPYIEGASKLQSRGRGRLGPAVPPWSLSEAQPKTLASPRLTIQADGRALGDCV